LAFQCSTVVCETVDLRDDFLELFGGDRAHAEAGYKTLRAKLKLFFRHRLATDPEGLTDEVIFRVIRRLAEGATAPNLAAFCFGVASNVLREAHRRREPVELESVRESGPPPSPHQLTAQETAILLQECLSALSPADRSVLTEYYTGDRAALADKLGVTPNALRLMVFRAKQRIDEMLETRQLGEPIIGTSPPRPEQ